MSKLGFVVGHPTQFEVPLYRFITSDGNEDNLTVYYFSYTGGVIHDKELESHLHNKWGINLTSGYQWKSISQRLFFHAKRILRENDYVIINGYTSKLSWFLIVLSCFYHSKIGMRMDTVLWNNDNPIKRVLKSVLLKVLSRFVDVFWVTGQKSKEFLKTMGITESRMKVLSYVVDNDWFKYESGISNVNDDIRKKFNIPRGDKVILTIVKLVKRETPEDLIKAFGEIKTKNTCLIIVGDGDLRADLEEKSRIWAQGKIVVFTGYIPYIDLPKIYSFADLYVHTSENEPWGVSVQEAMACGLPVITSQFVGSSYDLIYQGQNGMLYNHGNIKELSDKIDQVLNFNKDSIIKVNTQILQNFDYQTTWKRVSDHIETIAKTHNQKLHSYNKHSI